MTRPSADEIVYGLSRTTLGWAVAAASPRGLCALFLHEDRNTLRSLLLKDFPSARAATPRHPLRPLIQAGLEAVRRAGAAQGKARRGTPPLDLRGTPFQRAVWRSLLKIPRSKTASYREVAEGLGLPRAARAVAAACAANRVAVLVPCHRVVRGDGSLSGYRWGIARKRALLEAESASAASVRLKRAGSSKNAE